MYKYLIILLAVSICFNLLAQDKMSYYVLESLDLIGPIYGEEYENSSQLTNLMFLSPLRIQDNQIDSEILIEETKEKTTLENGCEKYIFQLNDNIKWDNGNSVTAYDIEFTFNVISNENVSSSNAKSKTHNIRSVKALDFYEIEIIFDQVYEYNDSSLLFKVLPKDVLYDSSKEDPYIILPDNRFFSGKQVCNGMYKAKTMYEMLAFLERNENFYDLQRKPRIKEIEVSKRDNRAMFIEALLGEDINFLTSIPIDAVERVQNATFHDVIKVFDNRWQFIAFNLRKPIFSDINLRRVMDLAVNKVSMNLNILRNAAKTITGPYPDGSPFYNYNYQPEIIDIESLNKILDEAGYIDTDEDGVREKDGNPLCFEMSFLGGYILNDQIFQSITNFYKNVGIDLRSRELNPTDYIKEISMDHDFDLALWSYSVGTDPDIYTFFASSEDRVKGQNICGMRDFDDQLEEIRRENDKENKIAKCHQIHEDIAEYHPGIFLWRKPLYVGYKKSDFPGIKTSNVDGGNIFRYIYEW
jgi:peptide/nickel transport system substrate-binding protein